jgi:hypothetical protein
MKSASETMQAGDDNRAESSADTGSLDPTARDRISAKKIEARCKLQDEVTAFLSAMRADAELLLGRNPVSEDLLPFFLDYWKAVFEAETNERLLLAISLPEKIRVLNTVLTKIHDQICSANDGVWSRTVSLGCNAVNFGSWNAGYGAYDRGALIVPRRKQLWAKLRIFAMHRALELAKDAEANTLTKPIGAARQSDANLSPDAPKSARISYRKNYLQIIMDENHWTKQMLAKKSGISEGTIRNIFRERDVGPTSLATIEENLSSVLGYTIRMP